MTCIVHFLFWWVKGCYLSGICCSSRKGVRASPPFEQTNSSVYIITIHGQRNKTQGRMHGNSTGGPGKHPVHWEETHACMVSSSRKSTKEGDTISFEGCACSPLKKGREANSPGGAHGRRRWRGLWIFIRFESCS
jgi:hypothetical protein